MNDYFVAVVFSIKDNKKEIIDVKRSEGAALSLCASVNIMKYDYKLDYRMVNLAHLLQVNNILEGSDQNV